MSIQYTVLGFGPTTFRCESNPITTKPWLPLTYVIVKLSTAKKIGLGTIQPTALQPERGKFSLLPVLQQRRKKKRTLLFKQEKKYEGMFFFLNLPDGLHRKR